MKPPAPSRIVWRKLGQPDCGKREPKMKWSLGARCGRCLDKSTETALARPALSAQFGSWDEIMATTDGMQWLCRSCAWSYVSMESRRRSYRVTARGFTPALWPTIAAELVTGPVPPSVAWSIPVGGKRIVLPRADWGLVATDHMVTPWTAGHADALRSVLQLRAAGVTESDLKSSRPLLGYGATPEEQMQNAHSWDSLSQWRESVLWQLFVKLSRPSRIAVVDVENPV